MSPRQGPIEQLCEYQLPAALCYDSSSRVRGQLVTIRNRLDAVTIRGFKTIKALEAFEPRHLTVLIGANGAGKSNFISFFRMLSWALSRLDKLPDHVVQQGRASALLHDGQETTREIEAELTLSNKTGRNQYAFRLVYAANDTLVFAEENTASFVAVTRTQGVG